MAVRFRRSFTLLPGVRLTLSKTGLSISLGAPGLRRSVHTSGRRTTSVGVPGSGVSYVTTSKRRGSGAATTGRRSRRRDTATAAPSGSRAPAPDVDAAEATLDALLAVGAVSVAQLDRVARTQPGQWLAASTLAGLRRAEEPEPSDAAVTQLRMILQHPTDPADDPLLQEHLGGEEGVGLRLPPGLTVYIPVSRDLIGLTLADVLRRRGELDAAIDVVSRLQPSLPAAVALADLYTEAGRHLHVLRLTDGVRNEDDLTAALCVYRGKALMRQGHHEDADWAFTTALRAPERAQVVQDFASAAVQQHRGAAAGRETGG